MNKFMMTIEPVVTGALIAGGASLAAGGASAFANANMNKKNRNWQEKMVKDQRAHEQKLYDERYSPSAQVQNLRAAGINPTGNTQTMNVGSSTSTPTPATTPQDFSFIGQAGQAIASGLHSRQVMKLEQDRLEHQVLMDWKEDLYKQIELAHSREELDSIKKEREERIYGMREERRGKKITNDFQQLLLDQLDTAIKMGYNRFENEDRAADDAHNESQQRVKGQKFINDINDEFGKEFYRLDYKQRQQEVQDFLDNKENRQTLMDCAVAIQENIKSVSDREEAIDSLQSQYERDIAQRILDATKDGNAIDGVILKFLTDNPFATVNVLNNLTHFVPSSK